jgi:hypothetical protein
MAIAVAVMIVGCRRERPGSHLPCGGMTYPPPACPAGEECVDVPGRCNGHVDDGCPTYCVTAQPR